MSKTMFLNNIEYTAQDFVDLFSGLTNNGIRSTDDMKVVASTPNALTVDVGAGKMFVNGYFVNLSTTTKIAITANTSGYNRKDIICVKVDTNSQNTSVVVIEGTPSSSPVSPSIPVVDGENYVKLATITVGNNATVITSSNIEDNRLVTKIWDDYNSSFNNGVNGYMKFPNGFIIQWGETQISLNNTNVTGAVINYPVKFPKFVFFVGSNNNNDDAHAAQYISNCLNNNLSYTYMRVKFTGGDTTTATRTFQWFAIGK